MSSGDLLEFGRVVAVIAIVIAAAALATPKGRLPLALRGVVKILRRDSGRIGEEEREARAPAWKRLVAFLLVIIAVILAVL